MFLTSGDIVLPIRHVHALDKRSGAPVQEDANHGNVDACRTFNSVMGAGSGALGIKSRLLGAIYAAALRVMVSGGESEEWTINAVLVAVTVMVLDRFKNYNQYLSLTVYFFALNMARKSTYVGTGVMTGW